MLVSATGYFVRFVFALHIQRGVPVGQKQVEDESVFPVSAFATMKTIATVSKPLRSARRFNVSQFFIVKWHKFSRSSPL